MIRAPMGDTRYWEKWTQFGEKSIAKDLEQIQQPPGIPIYRPQFLFDLAREHPRLMITRYSRGDPINDLDRHFAGLLDAWALSNKLAEEVCREHGLRTCRDWTFDLSNLNHYNWCFWLVGLALSLQLPDAQWQRLLALIDAEGQDQLLDRIIASRQPGRRIGTALLHDKPYARLLKAIDAPADRRADLLLGFVNHWYSELARKGKDELWWYVYGDPDKNPLEMGSYFGRWCIEAVAAVKAFSIDDSLCLGHEHYPGDLLRPDGPTTHPSRAEPKRGLVARLFGRKGT